MGSHQSVKLGERLRSFDLFKYDSVIIHDLEVTVREGFLEFMAHIPIIDVKHLTTKIKSSCSNFIAT